jgi:enamine deaminase RidA (YjgF/YER057c/UK114 family)
VSTVIQPPGWARPLGYANGIVASGRLVFIAGQVGWDPTSAVPAFADGFVAQFDRALENVVTVLRAAGGEPAHFTRMTVYVTDKREYLDALAEVGAAWKKHVGKHYPAMALVQIAGLVDDRAKVEIEATAVIP